MLNPRYIITLLVVAQIIGYFVGDFTATVHRGLIAPLLKLVFGSDNLQLTIGVFDVGTVIVGLFSCLISILLSLLMLRLVFKFAGRCIDSLIPAPTESQPALPK